jgi:hypothetical protein
VKSGFSNNQARGYNLVVESSAVQADIIRAIRNISWDAQLWFPIVQRQLLGLRTDAADEQIHAAIVAMIEKQALVLLNPYLPYTWEAANPREASYADPSLRRISTSAASETALNEALSSNGWVDEIAAAVQGGSHESGAFGSEIEITYLESQIILAIDHLGWFSFLWFPIVHREALNFGSNAPDEYVHRAFPSLIRKHALIPIHEEPGDRPDWQPEPNAFKTAVYKALGRVI